MGKGFIVLIYTNKGPFHYTSRDVVKFLCLFCLSISTTYCNEMYTQYLGIDAYTSSTRTTSLHSILSSDEFGPVHSEILFIIHNLE